MTDRTAPPRRIEGIDLLRGLAVGLVMLRHAWPDLVPGAGVVGVVMFFTLSGHLITGVLLEGGSLRDFYLRRVRRLAPALVLLVVGVVLVTVLFDPLHDHDELGRTVLFALTWTGDLPFGHASDATFHLWTLAVEEQFYLLWPAVVLLAARRQRLGTALGVSAALCLLACVATVAWAGSAPDLAYSLPTTWSGCFVIGAASRLVPGQLPGLLPGLVPHRLPVGAVPVALLGLTVLSVVPLRNHTLTYLVGGPVIAGLTALLIVAWREWHTVAGPLRGLVGLGTISYGAYLWNYPLTLWLRPSTGGWTGPLAIVLTVAVSSLSWCYVESPLLHRGRAARVSPPVPA